MGCAESRKATCRSSKCKCSEDACGIDGLCIKKDECLTDTVGTCNIGKCRESRNPVCKHNKCVCEEGKCAYGGTCVEKGSCPRIRVELADGRSVAFQETLSAKRAS